MANSSGSSIFNKLLSWLNGFFKTMASPISGMDMRDVKVKQEGDIFSSLFSFQAKPNETTNYQIGEEEKEVTTKGQVKDINGNTVEVDVLLSVTNAQSVFSDILFGLNTIKPEMTMEESKLFEVLLGPDWDRDLSIENAKKRSIGGLLGADLSAENALLNVTDATYNGKQYSWGKIAEEYLNWALECASPGKDPGMIDNQKLADCTERISQYLVISQVIQNEGEVKVDAYTFALPIIMRMQAWLTDYYEKAIKKYLPEGKVTITDAEDNAETQATEQPTSEEQTTQEGQVIDMNILNESGDLDDVSESKHIDVTLQKITGTTDVKMTAIKANYGYSDVLDDIDEIINQDEFIQALPEEPTTYAISVDDDGFDIEPCEESLVFNPCESLCEVFKSGIRAYRNLYILHWMAKGNDMMKLHLLAEDMYEELIKEIDTIGELLVEKQGTVPQLDFPCDYLPIQDYDFQTGLDQIQSLINIYIDTINYAYCNQDPDVQSVLDEWLRYWKKQTRYFVERQEV